MYSNSSFARVNIAKLSMKRGTWEEKDSAVNISDVGNEVSLIAMGRRIYPDVFVRNFRDFRQNNILIIS